METRVEWEMVKCRTQVHAQPSPPSTQLRTGFSGSDERRPPVKSYARTHLWHSPTSATSFPIAITITIAIYIHL